MTKTLRTRFESFYAELVAKLQRHPGKRSFTVRREMLEGLAHEMARVAYALQEARDREGERDAEETWNAR